MKKNDITTLASEFISATSARRAALALMVCGAGALPIAALAQTAPAYTNGPTIMRAGPDNAYPEVLRISPGVPVRVMGCVPDYEWCDVAMPQARGWVHGERLNYEYYGNNVPLMQYGAQIGFPIVGFSIGSYWDQYYRGRPWFNERDRWEQRPPPGAHWGGYDDRRGGPPPGGSRFEGQRYEGPHNEGPRGPEHGPGAQQFHGGPPQGVGGGRPGGGPGQQAEQSHGGPGPGGGHGGPPQGGHGPGPGAGHNEGHAEGGHGGGGGEHGGPPH